MYGSGMDNADILISGASVAGPALAWWLSRYRFGPAEWVWRWMTYGKGPQMKRVA